MMQPGETYHIYNRGNNRETIFKEERNYHYFLQKFHQYLSPFVSVHAYCLMPNHFHFIVQILENDQEVKKKKRYLKPIDFMNSIFMKINLLFFALFSLKNKVNINIYPVFCLNKSKNSGVSFSFKRYS